MAKITKRLPADVKVLLELIYTAEMGPKVAATAERYNTIFGHRQNRIGKPITKMTLRELQQNQLKWGSKSWVKQNWGLSTASSASGAIQLMRATGEDVFSKLKLDLDKTYFTPELQDDIGWYLLRRRGLDDWRFGRLTDNQFAIKLAQEWASIPVLNTTKGQHRTVSRGQSYYAGDALNKSTVTPEQVERALALARAERKAEGSQNAPQRPEKGPSGTDIAVGGGLVAGGGAVAVEALPDGSTDQLQTVLDNVGIFGASGSQVMAAIGAVLIVVVTGVIVWRMFKRK